MKSLRQSPLIQSFMPQLRTLRRHFNHLKYSPQIFKEEFVSRRWAQATYKKTEMIEAALQKVLQQGGYFGGWALSRSALRTFCVSLFSQKENPLIVECGSGQSTLFWSELHKSMAFRYFAIEHDPVWFEQLKPKLAYQADFEYRLYPLKQYSPQELEVLFAQPERAAFLAQEQGQSVSASEASKTRLENAFYDLEPHVFFEPQSIDGLVLDGPNGSGRSIAFVVLYPLLKLDAWILLDDFDHYPFLDQLGRVFRYKLEHVQLNAGKRWCLVQLEGRVSA